MLNSSRSTWALAVVLLVFLGSELRAQQTPEQLCQDSGGSWDTSACGHATCGVPNSEDCLDPGCQCPSRANFVVGEGCRADSACPLGTMSRESACVNDGSVEFCIPTGDRAAAAAVQAIVPSLVATSAYGGRAQCWDGRSLVMLPVEDLCSGRTISDEGWAVLEALYALPFVTEIVATWYE